jgi:hypothetical protein
LLLWLSFTNIVCKNANFEMMIALLSHIREIIKMTNGQLEISMEMERNSSGELERE